MNSEGVANTCNLLKVKSALLGHGEELVQKREEAAFSRIFQVGSETASVRQAVCPSEPLFPRPLSTSLPNIL